MSKQKSQPPLMAAAEELLGAVADLERLSARVSELNLPTWKAIVRGGDLLGDAVQAHQRFATALAELSELVGGLRDRHNAAADVLAGQAARIDARRVEHQTFEQRFEGLAAAARETDELLKGIPKPDGDDPATHAAEVAVGLGAVREHLARAADEARSVAGDAATAGFVDLQQQAEQVDAQLTSMMRKLASAAPDA